MNPDEMTEWKQKAARLGFLHDQIDVFIMKVDNREIEDCMELQAEIVALMKDFLAPPPLHPTGSNIPGDIVVAANKVSNYFKEQGIDSWAFMGLRNR